MQREFSDKEIETRQPTGWSFSHELYEQHIRERAQAKAETQNVSDSYAGDNIGVINEVGSFAGAVSRIVDNDSDDPEERRRRIEAEENGSTLGTLLGLSVGLIANVADDIAEDTTANYSYEDNRTREEILYEIFGTDDYDEEDYDDDEDEGFSMSL